MSKNERFHIFYLFFITYLVLPLFSVFVFGFFLLIFANTSHAESSYFPMNQDDNNYIPSVVTNYMDYVFDSDHNYILAQCYENSSSYLRFNVYIFSKESTGTICVEKNNNGYQFSFYQVGTLSSPLNVDRYYKSVTFNKSSGNCTNANPNGNFFTKTSNINSSLYDSTCGYVSNFIVYTSNVDETREVVLKYGPDPNDNPIGDFGVAIIPPTAFTPSYTSGDSAPTSVPPSFTINNYTWTTAPQFDGTTVIDGIQSIKNTLDWFADNIKNSILNLITNLKGLADYIAKTIQYYGNAIIETLNNLIQNFYDNMHSLVEDIASKIAYVIEPVDQAALTTSFTSTNFYGVKTQFTSLFNTYDQAFDFTEPSTFTLTINIQNIDTFYNFGCRSPVIIHLDDHFTPIKAALRTFLWVVLSFSTVIVVEHGLSNWLRGDRKE